MKEVRKLTIKRALLAGAMTLATGAAYAAPDYCGPDGTYTDTATDPDSILTVDEVTLSGINSNDCYGVVLDPNNVNTTAVNTVAGGLWGGGWSGEAKSDDNSTFTVDGVTFAVEATAGTSGTWELTLSGDPQTITIDFIVALKAADRWAAYFFDDWSFLVPSDPDGTYKISYVNKGGNTPALSHLSFFVRDGAKVPEPASLFLLGIGLAGLAFVQRRRRRA